MNFIKRTSECEIKTEIVNLNLSFFFTGLNSSGGSKLCNLCRLPNVVTNSSSTYRYTKYPIIELNASLAVNGKYQNHREGDCAGTDVGRNFTRAWWSVSLPGLATIYKVNLLFRENSKFLE